MTGNNKFWRASLAGLASVAMLATMGVAASTANADDAAGVAPYNFKVTLNAGDARQGSLTVDGKSVQTATFSSKDDADLQDGYLNELYANSVYRVTNANANTFTGWYLGPDYGAEKFDYKDTFLNKDITLYAHYAEPDDAISIIWDGSYVDGAYDSAEISNAGYARVNGLIVAKQDKKIAKWEVPTDKAGDQALVSSYKTASGDSVTTDQLTSDFTGKLNPKDPKVFNLTPVVNKDVTTVTFTDTHGVDKTQDIAWGSEVKFPDLYNNTYQTRVTEWKDSAFSRLSGTTTIGQANGSYWTFFATKWQKAYKVNFYTEINGKDVKFSDAVVDEGKAATPATAPARNEGSFSQYTDTYQSSAVHKYTGSAFDFSKIVKEGNAVAQWAVDSATVTFDYNYAGKTDEKSYATDQTFTAPTPTRAGYQFLGWYYAAGTVGNEYADGNPFVHDAEFVKAFLTKNGKVTKDWDWNTSRDAKTYAGTGTWLTKQSSKVTPPNYYNAKQVPANAKLRITAGNKLQYLNVSSTETPDGTETSTNWKTIPNTLYAAWGKVNKVDVENGEQQVPIKPGTDYELETPSDFVNPDEYEAAMKDYFALKNQYGSTPTADQLVELSAKLEAAKALLKETTDTVVYRLYNPYNHGDHLYTTDKAEYEGLQKLGWQPEGPQFKVLAGNKYGLSTAVYRVYNPYNGEHLLSTDSAEVDSLVKAGWQADNDGEPVFYAPQGGDVAVTRLFNPYETVGTHLYSTDASEIAKAVEAGWVKDNPATIFSTR